MKRIDEHEGLVAKGNKNMPPNSIKALLDVVVVASELFSSFHSSHLAYVNEEAAIAHNPFLFPLSITI
jgi:hypothetical protein